MLKVFTELIPGIPHIPLLYPNLGRPENEGRMPFLNDAFGGLKDKIVETAGSPSEADYILIPHNFPSVRNLGVYLQKMTDFSEDHGKKIIVFWHGDSCEEVMVPNAVVFRTSQYKSAMRDNETIIPPYAPDLLERRKLELRHKAQVPVIGFCGWGRYAGLKNTLATIAKNAIIDFRRIKPKNRSLAVYKKGLTFRMKAFRVLNKSKFAAANFILRDSYSGSSHTIRIDPDSGREEYIQNMLGSDFPLAVKGDGNYSYRFYEALSLGRIPLLIDTDCILPFEDKIDYSSFIVRVDYKDIPRIDKIVSEFYDGLNEQSFRDMQIRAREAFEGRLCTEAFLRGAIEQLKM